MFGNITHNGKMYRIDFAHPLDISIPLRPGTENVNAWYVNPVKIEPVINGNWIGDVNQGGSVNFRNITFNPHGNGTHTECVGHISKEPYTINQCLRSFFFMAELISILPQQLDNGDWVITQKQLSEMLDKKKPEALVIRTLSNPISKINQHYSNTNPPYILAEAMEFIHSIGVQHLLFDMPSVDRENDQGVLAAHHIFWQYPHQTHLERTITEMIYVPNTIVDGTYLLNLQIASFENDASPSKPVLYQVMSS